MAEFERGDIVVYRHTKNGEARGNGSLGIVTGAVDFRNDPVIEWVSLAFPKVARAPYQYNLEKVGHIDLPTR